MTAHRRQAAFGYLFSTALHLLACAAFAVGWTIAPEVFSTSQGPTSVEILASFESQESVQFVQAEEAWTATCRPAELWAEETPPEPRLAEMQPPGPILVVNQPPAERTTVASAASLASAAREGAKTNSQPRPILNPAPAYPLEAINLRQEGRVVLRVLVNAVGTVETLTVSTGSGFPLLDQASIAAVRQWRFEPGRRLGQPAAVTVLIPVRFSIQR